MVHIRTHLPVTFFHTTDPECEFKTWTARGLSRQEETHVKVRTSIKKLECPRCGQAYRNPSALERHERTQEEEDRLYFEYPGCGQPFCDPSTLETHKRGLV
jgi:hypothetical protein